MAENIKLAKGQHLADVMDMIPSNVILNKVITGCGATTLEIRSERNSIIIEPNVPVIEGKAAKHKDICPVYEKVSAETVRQYLRRSTDGYKKIVTTPEGYATKVKPALEEIVRNYHSEYFMLFDECEKIIQDVDYRGDIHLPVDDFFKFEGKAMVSATPIWPRDPRFREQGFDMMRVEPTYDYKPRIELCVTNNTMEALGKLIEAKQRNICIFINSTDTIYRVIEALNLQDRCKVFCSEKSVKKLRERGFRQAYQNLQELAAINFFTSRFYSAVDIELDYRPAVVLLSDVVHAPFSSVDPATEVIQAIGRFRNGTSGSWHITNTNPKIRCVTPKSLEDKLLAHEQVYKSISTMTVETLSHKNAQEQALTGMEHKRFVTTTGERFHFMWDNAHDDERIKSYYLGTRRLYDAYDNAPLVVEKKEWYTTLSDSDRMHRESPSLTKPKRWQEIIRQARKVYEALGCNATEEEVIAHLGEQYRDMIHAIYIIGAREIANLKYNERAIAEAIKQREHFNEVRKKAASDVYSLMTVGNIETVKNINDTMKMILDTHHIKPIGRVDKRYVELFFVIEDVKRQGDRCFVLKRRR
jgi:hypothetical protein